MPEKIDSNLVDTRVAEELFGSLGVLPGSPIWLPLEPDSFGEFGPQITTKARAPINSSRQRKKAMVVDLDVTGGIQQDFVNPTLMNLLPGFMFADWRMKPNPAVTAVSGTVYTMASTAGFAVGDLVWAEGFSVAGNNGLKQVTAVTGTTLAAAGLAVEASPPAAAKVTRVGVQAASGDLAVAVSGGVATITSTTLNFTTLGLIPGEWLFTGGDTSVTQFASAANNGFVRVRSVAANAIVLDRQPGTMVADAGTGKTIRLFFGHVIKNETAANLIKMRSYQFERTLAGGGFEYLRGMVANTLEIKAVTADKVTLDLGYVGIDSEYRTTVEGAKTGTRPALGDFEAYNGSSDFSRLRLLNENTAATLFTYVTELTLTINNNVSPSKAVGVLGAFDVTAGDFVAAGSVDAYFTTVDAVKAVRDNTDVSLDFALVKENSGCVFDVPFITLGDGRLNIEKDKEIKVPLSMEGAQHPLYNHSLLVVNFTYLPNAAQ